ncbi:hypothetical protein K439DRAFT_757429 [Ramaria rubella]|nr:hypothetical protein K439DRAFT_757429 [Ramaria rubella]
MSYRTTPTSLIKVGCTEYRRGAEAAFLATIEKYFLEPEKKYAHHVAVVQSSGTGKSRMLLEVTRKVFGVILNFGTDDMNGYPGPDKAVRDYLCKTDSAEVVEQRTIAFLTALFDRLSGQDGCKLSFESPTTLSEFIGYGDSTRVGERKQFFEDNAMEPLKTRTIPSTARFETQGQRSLDDAATDLDRVIRSAFQSGHAVQFIPAFDEACEMAIDGDKRTWNVFTCIRRVLRSLQKFFTVFMSTTESVHQFHPCQSKDRFTRIQDSPLDLWPPFTLLGFDQLVGPLAVGCNLDDATKVDFLVLDIPYSRHDTRTNRHSQGIIRFAAVKLQGGQDVSNVKIAPLAVRLPLTSNSMTPEGRDAEQLQVESHMRIRLNIVPASDAMYTLSP